MPIKSCSPWILWVSTVTFAVLGIGCTSTGACIEPATPGSSIHQGSCIANTTQSTCSARREFVPGDAQASAALCRSRGFTHAPGNNGTTMTPAEVEATLASGGQVTFFPELAR